jgi:glycyl-tRNA synthetase beta chain
MIAIADKMDLIVGCWWKGFAPTGSADPYGIRRAAQGVIAILWEHQLELSLQQLVAQASIQINDWVESQNKQNQEKKIGGTKLEAMPASIGQAVCSYLADRVKAFFADRYRQALVDAVVSVDRSVMVVQVGQRLKQLSSVWNGEAFAQAVKVAERTANIVRGNKGADGLGEVKPELFEHATERQLWEVVQRERQPILDLVGQERYADAVKRYGEAFAEPVHQFFYDVMVNVENEPVRKNRLAMMDVIFRLLATQVADLSTLAQSVTEQEKAKVS